jgi:cell division topological specificity factor
VELFKKLLGFRTPGTDEAQASKLVAKERLKLALTYDRSDLPRGTIEHLRDDIIQLISKHLAIDAEEIQISFDHTPEHGKLIASIPLRKAQRPRPQMAAVTAPQGAETKATPPKAQQRHRRR